MQPLAQPRINGSSGSALCWLSAAWRPPTKPLSEWPPPVASVRQPHFVYTFNASCTSRHRRIATPFTRRIETRIEYEDEHAYYVHAGVLPDKPIWRTSGLHKMWGARGFLESTCDWGKPVVFGHWQLSEPLVQPNKIGIDTGAFRSGRLTAVRLPDRQIFQVQRGLADSILKQV